MPKEISMRMARAYPEQIESMRKWFQELEEMLDDETKENADIGLFVANTFEQRRIDEYERVLFGYETIFNNACDPTLSYLSFKPEILQAIAEFQQRKAQDAQYLCARCGHAESEHSAYGCVGFSKEGSNETSTVS
jgi:hypothetical protein